MFGVEPFTSGVVELDGRPVRIRSPRDAVQLGLAFVTEDRKAEGLVLGADAQENGMLALRGLGSRRRRQRLGGVDPDDRVERAAHASSSCAPAVPASRSPC